MLLGVGKKIDSRVNRSPSRVRVELGRQSVICRVKGGRRAAKGCRRRRQPKESVPRSGQGLAAAERAPYNSLRRENRPSPPLSAAVPFPAGRRPRPPKLIAVGVTRPVVSQVASARAYMRVLCACVNDAGVHRTERVARFLCARTDLLIT